MRNSGLINIFIEKTVLPEYAIFNERTNSVLEFNVQTEKAGIFSAFVIYILDAMLKFSFFELFVNLINGIIISVVTK